MSMEIPGAGEQYDIFRTDLHPGWLTQYKTRIGLNLFSMLAALK